MKRPDTERGIRWWEYVWYVAVTTLLLGLGLLVFLAEGLLCAVRRAKRGNRR